jgi:tripeptide aminopeptidase
VKDVVSEVVARTLDLAIAVQQIPAPTFLEADRAIYIQERFQTEGLRDVSRDTTGNVYARLPGEGLKPPLMVSAHLDTVFPMQMDLHLQRDEHTIQGAGIGDNALGVAGLFGLVWLLKERHVKLPGDVWLAANVSEEGLGDLVGMRAVVDRFDGQVLAYVVLEGMALGQIYHRGLGVNRYRIGVVTPGGHSWVNKDRPSAIHELAKLVTRITGLPVPEKPRTTINVGVINGGISVNTIAPEAFLELDLRSEDGDVLADLATRVVVLVESAKLMDVRVTADRIGDRPQGAIPADHPLVGLAVDCLESLGIQPQLNIGSTDANIPLSRGYPAVCIGLTTGTGAHTVGESIDISPLANGLDQLVKLVEGVYRL